MVALINTIADDAFDRETVTRICSDFDDRPDALLEILHKIQASDGFLSDMALRHVATILNISRAEVHGVVSFYHDFKREPQSALTIKICQAEACQAVGCDDLVSYAKTMEKENILKVEPVYCLGNCALGPAMMIDDRLYGRVTNSSFEALITEKMSE